MLTRFLLLVALSVWPALAIAQDTAIHTATPEGGTRLPGCRVTLLLGEGLIGHDYLFYGVLWNPLPVAQVAEVTIFDGQRMSPPFTVPLAAFERMSVPWHVGRRLDTDTFRAVSVQVRWEIGGESHLTTWRVPSMMPSTLAEWIAWIRQWRVELVSPVQRETICYQ